MGSGIATGGMHLSGQCSCQIMSVFCEGRGRTIPSGEFRGHNLRHAHQCKGQGDAALDVRRRAIVIHDGEGLKLFRDRPLVHRVVYRGRVWNRTGRKAEA